jgi:hypothetical protein
MNGGNANDACRFHRGLQVLGLGERLRVCEIRNVHDHGDGVRVLDGLEHVIVVQSHDFAGACVFVIVRLPDARRFKCLSAAFNWLCDNFATVTNARSQASRADRDANIVILLKID